MQNPPLFFCVPSIFRRWQCLALAALVLCFCAPHASAQSDAASHFPDVNRLAADYPDDAERYTALNLLWDWLHAKAEKSPDALQKRKTYYDTSQSIRNKYIVKGPQADKDFNDRFMQLSLSKDFRSALVAKYNLAEVQADKAPASPMMQKGPPPDVVFQMGVYAGAPFILLSMVLVVFIQKRVIVKTGYAPPINPPRVRGPDEPPGLPENLRVVKVPGLEYELDVQYGFAFDKETTIHTYFNTTTTPGQTYTVGNTVYSTPGHTTTTASSTQQDVVWILTPENHETSWTFTGGSFKVRPGQFISVVTNCPRTGKPEFLMACNHNTGQCEKYGGIHNQHRAKAFAGWMIGSLVGWAGFTIGLWFINRAAQPPANAVEQGVLFLVTIIEGGLASLIFAGLSSWFGVGSVMSKRTRAFNRQYAPALQQFLQQATPAVSKCYEALANRPRA